MLLSIDSLKKDFSKIATLKDSLTVLDSRPDVKMFSFFGHL